MTTTPKTQMLERMSYPGGKNGAGVYQKIINLMPPHDVYIEPFLGGAAIMRLKRPARLNIGVDLVPSSELPLQAFIARFNGPGSRAISAEGGYPGPLAESGEVRSRRPLAESGERRRSSVPASSAEISKSSDSGSLHIIKGDGIEFLKSYRFSGNELVYCDPPYLMETRSGRKLYQYEMSSIAHRRLLRVLQDLKCNVVISGYWSEMYASTLKSWNSIHFQTMTRGGRTAEEWVWFNFSPPLELHDYRFLGENFRERERINRKKARWTARLRRMPILERQSLLSAISEFSQGASLP